METIYLKALQRRHEELTKGYWFSPDTSRFFNSRYPHFAYRVDNKAFFITSEQFDDKHPRLYTLRVMDWHTGQIATEGEFQQYQTRRQAERAMMKLIQRLERSVPAVDRA